MDNHPTEPVNIPGAGQAGTEGQDLDKLLSLRGKPFADWKEERLYLRGKWGMQGQKVNPGESASPKPSKKKKS
jgi:hypothetical protein